MNVYLYRLKESFERISGLHLTSASRFPWIHVQRRFLGLHLDLQNKCNLRCRMCYFSLEKVFHAPQIEMSDAVIERMMKEIWPVTAELWLTVAAEPLLASKLDTVLPQAKRSGIPVVHLVTNGLALNEAKANMIVHGQLDWLHVSIDGACRETYEAIRVNSRFDTVIGNIRRLQAIKAALGTDKPVLTVDAVMMHRNMGEWVQLVHMAADLGARQVNFMPQVYYDEVTSEERFWADPKQVNEALRQVAEAAALRKVTLLAPAPFPPQVAPPAFGEAMAPPCADCYMPWNQIVLYPDGEMAPCPNLCYRISYGNLARKHFKQIYFGNSMRQLRESMRTKQYNPICLNCATPRVKHLRHDVDQFLQRKIAISQK